MPIPPLQVCEPLCFIQSNIGTDKTPKSAVLTTLIGFYTDEDIYNAKELLFSFARSVVRKSTTWPETGQEEPVSRSAD